MASRSIDTHQELPQIIGRFSKRWREKLSERITGNISRERTLKEKFTVNSHRSLNSSSKRQFSPKTLRRANQPERRLDGLISPIRIGWAILERNPKRNLERNARRLWLLWQLVGNLGERAWWSCYDETSTQWEPKWWNLHDGIQMIEKTANGHLDGVRLQ